MSTALVANDRIQAVERGRRLEYFTIAWNCLEGLVALIAGFGAGSIALVGFGFDSLIEVTSGSVLLWRLQHDHNKERREKAERTSLRLVGFCFIWLAIYIAYDSVRGLWMQEAPERSLPGVLLAVASLIVMPRLSKAKRKVAAMLDSAAMNADAKQTEVCTYLSAILLGGLLLNALLGLWWADPVAALLMAPIIAREGFEALQNKACVCR